MAIDEQESAVSAKLVSRSSGLVIGVAMVVANLANYGFQIVAGRFLTVEEYGLLAGFMAVITVVTVATSSLQTTAARAIATEEHVENGPVIDGLTRSSAAVGVVVVLAALIATPIASRFFNVGSLPLILLAVYVLPSALDSIAAGRLQGLQRFSALAMYSCGQAISKLTVATIVLAVGLRATGLVAGLVGSCAIVATAGLFATRSGGAIESHALDPDVRRAFYAFTMFWFMLGADVLFARAFFEGTEAGLYGAASVLGKSVLWIPAVVAQLLFPRLARSSKDGDSVSDLAVRAVVVVAVVVAVSVAVLFTFGSVLFRVLYGDDYVGASVIAWKIGLAVAPMALVNLLVQHFLARRQGHFLGWMFAVLTAETAALYLGPKTGTFYAIVIAVAGMALLLAMVPTYAWRRHMPRQLTRRPGG